MRRIGIAGLVAMLIAMMALTAASGALASGGPEYLACGKAAKVATKYTGKYANKTCSETSPMNEGKYERVAAKFPIKYKSKFGATKIYLYNPKESKVESEVPCAKGKATGSITNSRAGTVTITYEECVVPPSGKFPGPCTSPGQKKTGIVVTKPLATKLVWLDEHESVPGVLVTPAEPSGPFEEVTCFFGKVKVKQTGSLLAKLTPVDEATKLLTASFFADPMTGEPEFGSYWEGGMSTNAGLFSEVHAPDNIEESAVPTSETSTVPLKSGAVLVS